MSIKKCGHDASDQITISTSSHPCQRSSRFGSMWLKLSSLFQSVPIDQLSPKGNFISKEIGFEHFQHVHGRHYLNFDRQASVSTPIPEHN
jgi:hypothetical protein